MPWSKGPFVRIAKGFFIQIVQNQTTICCGNLWCWFIAKKIIFCCLKGWQPQFFSFRYSSSPSVASRFKWGSHNELIIVTIECISYLSSTHLHDGSYICWTYLISKYWILHTCTRTHIVRCMCHIFSYYIYIEYIINYQALELSLVRALWF